MNGTIKAFLDRIEGDKAVLLVGEEKPETVVIPAEFLPANAREGDFLSITIVVDETATNEARQRVQDILRRLTGSNSEH